jgi:hypothetical protein
MGKAAPEKAARENGEQGDLPGASASIQKLDDLMEDLKQAFWDGVRAHLRILDEEVYEEEPCDISFTALGEPQVPCPAQVHGRLHSRKHTAITYPHTRKHRW